jgi:ATP-dependent exoDNAse (exonuclease V) alpha subunit
MPVAVNQNFDVRAGVVNGSTGYLRAVRCVTDVEGRRYLDSCVVEIPGSDPIEMGCLPEHYFPILPDVTELKFEHPASRKRCVIQRKQVPIQPGFAMTAHKAQGQTMHKVVVDLAGCSGTEQPYVMVSRSTSLEGLVILRDFDFNKITKRHSEDLRREFGRLEYLKVQTTLKHGTDNEKRQAKQWLESREHNETSNSRKRKANGGEERAKRARLTRG